MTILVTGGTGYIGSHTCVELLKNDFDVVVLDNLSNSKKHVVEKIETISQKRITFYQGDIQNTALLKNIFTQHKIEGVIHFAGLKAVGESCEKPLYYYQNNVAGTIALCEVMAEHNIHTFIFSSSATVYGEPKSVPITEDFATHPESPYGRSKLMVEDILKDASSAPNSSWKITLLRYFNPIGAHESGLIGEDPEGIPNNLLPYIAQVATGKLEKLRVFGNDYPTPDGTGIRDYIHVVDLAKGHVKALQKMQTTPPACHTYNLGTGKGYSVLEVIHAFEKACGKKNSLRNNPKKSRRHSRILVKPTPCKTRIRMGSRKEPRRYDGGYVEVAKKIEK